VVAASLADLKFGVYFSYPTVLGMKVNRVRHILVGFWFTKRSRSSLGFEWNGECPTAGPIAGPLSSQSS